MKPPEALAKRLVEAVTHRTLTDGIVPPRQRAVDFR
jgi:hypothetical protein